MGGLTPPTAASRCWSTGEAWVRAARRPVIRAVVLSMVSEGLMILVMLELDVMGVEAGEGGLFLSDRETKNKSFIQVLFRTVV